MNNSPKFLGTGWSFPPAFDKSEGKVELTSGRVDIERSLEILLGTHQGERVMRPEYGCNLDEMVFESFDLSMKTYLKDLVETAILYHEPRIDLINISLDETFTHEGRILINIDYRIRSTNSRFNMVYPFYLKEGTEVPSKI